MPSRKARKPRRVREGAANPVWLTRAMLDALHQSQLREHGGRPGIRDEGLLESALSRPKNKHVYGERDLCVPAAAYAFGVIKNHAFVDGNKRTAFVAAAVFLALNGRQIGAPEPEVVDAVTRLAAGTMSERSFADWLRGRVTR